MALQHAHAPTASAGGPAAAPGVVSGLLGNRCRRRQQTLRRRRLAAAPAASFDLGSFNWNPLDFLKVPRDQAQLTLYPWMAGSMREMAMRRWLQKEVRVGAGPRHSSCPLGVPLPMCLHVHPWQCQHCG